MDDLTAEYARFRADAMGRQRKMQSASATSTSRQGGVTVTVGGAGEVTDLVFVNTRYRTMAPTELSHVLLETIDLARRQVLDQLVDTVSADTMVGGVSLRDVMMGTADWTKLLPETLDFPDMPDPGSPPSRGYGRPERGRETPDG